MATPPLRGSPIPPRSIPTRAILRAAVPPSLPRLTQAEFPGFIRNLRRTLPFYLFRVTNADERAKVERFLFWSNYKGSTDFFTKYVYPPLVWLMVRPLARAHVHPNWVTIISIVLTFAAVPLFGAGYFLAGFLCAYGMSVLDSVDGKLARLTFTDSKLGNVLDHGLDLVHPPFWYCAWAYGSRRMATFGRRCSWPRLLMLALYVIDRLILKIYPTRFGRGLHTHAPMDGFVRTFISRRNINLPLFTVGYVAGLGDRDDLPDRVLAGRHLRLSRSCARPGSWPMTGPPVDRVGVRPFTCDKSLIRIDCGPDSTLSFRAESKEFAWSVGASGGTARTTSPACRWAIWWSRSSAYYAVLIYLGFAGVSPVADGALVRRLAAADRGRRVRGRRLSAGLVPDPPLACCTASISIARR